MSRGSTSEDVGRRMLRREPPGRRSRRRPETGEMEDMKVAGVRKEDEEERGEGFLLEAPEGREEICAPLSFSALVCVSIRRPGFQSL